MNRTAPPPWYTLSSDEVASRLESSPSAGLPEAEAARRRATYGPNELAVARQRPAWQKFLEQFKDFIVLILIGAAIISGLLGEMVDTVAIIAIVLLNAIIGFIQEYQAERAIEALREMTAPHARVLREGHVTDIPARDIVPGDVIAVEQGDIIPADARLIEAQALQVEEAALTGESVPAKKAPGGPLPVETGVGDQRSMLFASTRVTYGRGRAMVTGTAMDTELGRIADLVGGVVEEKTPLQQRLDEVGRYLVYGALAIVALVFLIGLVQGRNPEEMFLTAVSLAVAAVPEGLSAVVTIALALGVRRLAAHNGLIRRLPSVETLGATTVIASDKTGTLTQNQMTIRRIYTDGRMIEVGGEGYAPEGGFSENGVEIEPLDDPALLATLRTGAIANSADLHESEGEGRWTVVGDPTEGAILSAAAKAHYWRDELLARYELLAENPFDSDRKMMSVLGRNHEGELALFVKGAPGVVLHHCTALLRHDRIEPLSEAERERLLTINRELANQALRVLAIAQRPLEAVPEEVTPALEAELVFLGFVAMIDPPRPEAITAVAEAKKAGLHPVMITGDHRDTAVAIGRELGMMEAGDQAITGEVLERMSDEELAASVEKIRIYARVSPEHKLRIVRAWKARGQIVAMTGDGVNDAPALKEANIGIAMGITGTDVSKEAADMVLADDNFASIVAAVREGRAVFDNIRRFIQFLLSCNIGEVLAMFIAVLANLPLPLLPVQILWINLATDSLPALALGVEPAERDIMDRPPRDADEPILTRRLITLMVVQGLIIALVTLAAFSIAYFVREPGDVRHARVMAFITSIVAQTVHAFNLRSHTQSLFRVGLLSNPYLIGAAAVVLGSTAALIYIPFFQGVFQTVPLDLADWGWILGLGLVPLIVVEIGKALGLHK